MNLYEKYKAALRAGADPWEAAQAYIKACEIETAEKNRRLEEDEERLRKREEKRKPKPDITCPRCNGLLLLEPEAVGRMIECPLCGEAFAALFDVPKKYAPFADLILPTDTAYDYPTHRPHSGLGILAAILGAVGTPMLLVSFAAPEGNRAGDAIRLIGVLLMLTGTLFAAMSFAQQGRNRTCSWLGLILAGWPLAILALLLLFGGAAAAAGAAEEKKKGRRREYNPPEVPHGRCVFCNYHWQVGHPERCPGCGNML
jgi:hypothetical protein